MTLFDWLVLVMLSVITAWCGYLMFLWDEANAARLRQAILHNEQLEVMKREAQRIDSLLWVITGLNDTMKELAARVETLEKRQDSISS